MKTYLLACTAIILLLHEGLVSFEHVEELLVGSIVNEAASTVWAGDSEALFVISRFPVNDPYAWSVVVPAVGENDSQDGLGARNDHVLSEQLVVHR